jgi:hypothetical protein
MSNFQIPPLGRLSELDNTECEYCEEVVEIEGRVSSKGQSGSGRPQYTVHHFDLSAWRQPGQPTRHSELRVLRPVDPATDWQFEFPSRSIHRFRALLSMDQTSAIFVSASRTPAKESQLQEPEREQEQPVVLETIHFGDLWLNCQLDRFEGEAEWNGEEIEVNFESESDHDITTALAVAEKLWRVQRKWKKMVEDFAVQELLPLKNRTWLEDGEKPLTARQFKERMTLNSITFHADGSIAFWHDDGNLFLEHDILILGTLDGLTNAEISG